MRLNASVTLFCRITFHKHLSTNHFSANNGHKSKRLFCDIVLIELAYSRYKNNNFYDTTSNLFKKNTQMVNLRASVT